MATSPPQLAATSPVSVVFLLHMAVELPIAIQGLFVGDKLPFMEMTNTTLVLLKLYGALSIASCVMALLCYSLPEFLPGKRALALAMLLYHGIASAVLLQSPRFIPHSFGPIAESLTATPERLWGGAHALVAFGFATWWQVTLRYAQMAKRMQ